MYGYSVAKIASLKRGWSVPCMRGSSIGISEPRLMSWRANAPVPLPGLDLSSKGCGGKITGFRDIRCLDHERAG